MASARWVVEQIYVSKVLCPEELPEGMTVKSKGGVTISVRKRGGWQSSWRIAQKVAGWV